MEQKIDAGCGELIEITEGGGVVIIEPLSDASLFAARLTVDRDGEKFGVQLTAKECRKIGGVLREIVVGVKNQGYDRGRSRGWRD